MSSEHELFDELRNARRATHDALFALQDAKAVLRRCKQVEQDILAEIDTGKAIDLGKPRPLLDAIETPREPDFPPMEKTEWVWSDLERVLIAACCVDNKPDGVWTTLKRVGCDDNKILEVLRSLWPMTALFVPNPAPGCTIQGGSTCRFWMGARRPKDQQPTLAGMELADRIRRVLEIPRAQVEEPATTPRKSTRRRRAASDPARAVEGN